jgi:hypothetical protein
MSMRRSLLVALLASVLSAGLRAQETRPVEAQALLAFASEEGLTRLSRAPAKADFPTLANQFEAQSNAAFCGPTTAAIVLNAIAGASRDLPRDRSRLRSDDLKHLPATVDLTLPRFTQDNVFDKSPKTRAQVLGEPMVVDGKTMRDVGFQLRQLDALLHANGAATRLVIVGASNTEAEIRDDLRRNLERGGDYVIVNYIRTAVGQPGGGHISPLGAYDAASDSFLVLDVNPASAGWVWMPTATLVKGMRTFDTVENRGYIVVGPR